jgi:molybdopterin molybdotransferase
VARRPRVGVIATGDELVEPDVKPAASQIRTSNGYQITAHVATAGALPAYYGIARDTEAEIDAYLKRALAGNDVVLLSGGVSMGDYDFVPDVLRKNGVEILFDSIAMKPGKPTTFGVTADAYCFGLPGNPVSTFIQCEILVKPFLYALMGHAFRPPVAVMPLAKKFTRKSTGREAWIPVSFTDEGGVVPNEYHGSAHIHALCAADGLIVVPAGVASVAEGTLVRVRPL